MLKIAECRPEVQAFAVAMEEKLRANDHKGGWKGCCPLWLFQRAEDELEELRAEMPYHLHGQDGCPPAPFAESHPLVGFPDDLEAWKSNIIDESADVANFLMMMLDSWTREPGPGQAY